MKGAVKKVRNNSKAIQEVRNNFYYLSQTYPAGVKKLRKAVVDFEKAIFEFAKAVETKCRKK